MAIISVIVPVYKVENYLERCVKSILNQTFTDLEVILVDDHSPDGCPRICDELAAEDHRISVIHRAKNGGLGGSRNLGLEVASGEYIGFVDSDDWIAEDMYAYLLQILKQFQADIALCTYTRKADGIDRINTLDKPRLLSGRDIWKLFYRMEGENSNYAVWCRLYKRVLLEQVRFVEDKINEDVLFTYDAYKKANTLVVSSLKKYFYFNNLSGITRTKLSVADFALLEIWDEIVERERNTEYYEWATLNRIRATYTLYTKGLLYGRSDNISKVILKGWKKELNENYGCLMKSGFFDWKRKAILFAERILPVR